MAAADRRAARVLLRERGRQRLVGRAADPSPEPERALFDPVGRLIAEHLPASPVVAAYWPLAGEPDSRAALHRWHAAGWAIGLPQVLATDQPLRFLRWTPGSRLVEGPMRTRHPVDGPLIVPQVLVIPCLGFDDRGYRLGQGGGFYDRTLAGLSASGQRVFTIGVAYDQAQVCGFEAQPHDVPLDRIVTETGRVVVPVRPAPP